MKNVDLFFTHHLSALNNYAIRKLQLRRQVVCAWCNHFARVSRQVHPFLTISRPVLLCECCLLRFTTKRRHFTKRHAFLLQKCVRFLHCVLKLSRCVLWLCFVVLRVCVPQVVSLCRSLLLCLAIFTAVPLVFYQRRPSRSFR